MFQRPEIGMHRRFSVAAATRLTHACTWSRVFARLARAAFSARVDRVDDPLIAGLPEREVPPPRLDAQRSAPNLGDVAGIAGADSFGPGTGHRDVAAFEIERLFVELIERLGECSDVDARPHRVRRVGIKRAERVLIAIECQSNGARFRSQASGRGCAGSSNSGRWRCRARG